MGLNALSQNYVLYVIFFKDNQICQILAVTFPNIVIYSVSFDGGGYNSNRITHVGHLIMSIF